MDIVFALNEEQYDIDQKIDHLWNLIDLIKLDEENRLFREYNVARIQYTSFLRYFVL